MYERGGGPILNRGRDCSRGARCAIARSRGAGGCCRGQPHNPWTSRAAPAGADAAPSPWRSAACRGRRCCIGPRWLGGEVWPGYLSIRKPTLPVLPGIAGLCARVCLGLCGVVIRELCVWLCIPAKDHLAHSRLARVVMCGGDRLYSSVLVTLNRLSTYLHACRGLTHRPQHAMPGITSPAAAAHLRKRHRDKSSPMKTTCRISEQWAPLSTSEIPHKWMHRPWLLVQQGCHCGRAAVRPSALCCKPVSPAVVARNRQAFTWPSHALPCTWCLWHTCLNCTSF